MIHLREQIRSTNLLNLFQCLLTKDKMYLLILDVMNYIIGTTDLL